MVMGVHKDISDFAQYNRQYVSLGNNCLTAWYLKESGRRHASFPFDWVFSSPEIVVDCISDGFRKYLDRSLMHRSNDYGAGHREYHRNMFNHRSPLASRANYESYFRAVARFVHQWRNIPTTYIMNIPDPDADFPRYNAQYSNGVHPAHDYPNHILRLIDMFNDDYSQVILIHQSIGDRSATFKEITPQLGEIRMQTVGTYTGKGFNNKADDDMMMDIMSALPKPRSEIT